MTLRPELPQPIPAAIAQLPRHRGYPVPWFVCGDEERCSGCGRKPSVLEWSCPVCQGKGSNSGPYDSRPETQAHIDRVRHFINLAMHDLSDRHNKHDRSKLIEPERSAFDIATPKLAGMEYGSEEYKQSLRDLGPALAHHFEHNDHHPEHFENGVQGMSLMALIEMLCDWRAASERSKQRTDDPENVKTFESGLAFNQERFGYSDELAEILRNTVRELGL